MKEERFEKLLRFSKTSAKEYSRRNNITRPHFTVLYIPPCTEASSFDQAHLPFADAGILMRDNEKRSVTLTRRDKLQLHSR